MFNKVEIPPVAVGEEIKATIDFYAINPGALYWKSFLVVDSPGLNLKKVLDAAREVGQDGGRQKTYSLGIMPDKEIAISLFIFAHDDASYEWNWGEYQGWMHDLSTNVTYLGSSYNFLNPATPTPTPTTPPGDTGSDRFSGLITALSPAQVQVGKPIDITLSFSAYTESLQQQVNGWWTRVFVNAGGFNDSDSQFHIGRNGSRSGQTLNLGTMPQNDISGTIHLQAHSGGVLPTEPGEDGLWVQLDSRDFAIAAVSTPSPVPPSPSPSPSPVPAPSPSPVPDNNGGFNLPDWALPAGLVALGAILLLPSKK